jgi:hypothetical protein
MSKKGILVFVLAALGGVSALIWGVLWLNQSSGNVAWQTFLHQWGSWASAGVTAVALSAAAAYYVRTLLQSRTTHEFDVLMRTVAVFHDQMPQKRATAAKYLLERMDGATRPADASEEAAIIDLMDYFDATSWRAFTLFKMDLGAILHSKCKLAENCEHHWRPLVKQRHEGVRLVVREVGYPALMYDGAIKTIPKDSFPPELQIGMHTQYQRMVTAMARFPIDVSDPWKRRFLQREVEAPSLRPRTTSDDFKKGSETAVRQFRQELAKWVSEKLPSILRDALEKA